MRVDHPLRSAFDLLVRKAPIEAQLVVTRRCNLSCGYCSEYDKHSEEVPFEVLRTRIEAIHRLRAANIALLGGEPLMHSRIDDVVRQAARRAQVSLTTNGFLIDREMILRLDDAGLANLQVSIDAPRVDPTRYIQKTLKSLEPKLARLAETARFDVHVTTVLCRETVAQFDELMTSLARYPFRVSVNIVHDENGQALVNGPVFQRAWERHFRDGRPFSFIEETYGRQLLAGERPRWTCQAGARFLYVDEEGRVEFCSAQRGRIGKRITDYRREDLLAHRNRIKGCEEGCSIFCVYRDSMIEEAPFSLVRALLRGLALDRFLQRPARPVSVAGVQERSARHLPIWAD